MRMTLALVFVSVAACGVDTAEERTSVATNDVRIDLTRDDLEPTYVNGAQCSLVFQGALTPDTQMYLIWAVGTNGIVANAKYNTADRPNIYAIFGTSRPATRLCHARVTLRRATRPRAARGAGRRHSKARYAVGVGGVAGVRRAG